MIDQAVVDVAHGTAIAFLGTRDGSLHPHGAQALGMRIDAAAGTVAVFIPDLAARQVVADCRAAGRATVVFGHPVTHEAYQAKGEVLEIRPATEAEGAIQDVFVAKLMGALKGLGMPVEQWPPLPYKPATAIVIRMTDLFVQTPGPGAGSRIGP